MTNTLYLPELREMLAQNDAAELHEFTVALHPARTAEFMEGLTAAEAWAVLQHADEESRAAIFGYFDRDKQVEIIETSDRSEIGKLIADLPPDDRVDILKSVQPHLLDELLPFIPPSERRDILRLKSYPEETAGAKMTTSYAKIAEGLTVWQALEVLSQQAEEIETIYYVYVVDEQEHLRGVVSTRQLVSSIGRPQTKVADLMEREVVTVNVNDDQEKVAHEVARYDLHAIPVVDEERHMLGIITSDDIIDVLKAEASEDAYRMGAVAPLEEGYLDARFRTIWSKRAVWLSCLFVAELFTYTAMDHFDTTIKQILALTFFLPLCISAGGNSGSQAATLITRALALGQIKINDWWRVLSHELLMGLALGVTLGSIGFLRAYLIPPSSEDLGRSNPTLFAVVIALAVMTTCLWGTLVGSMLPLIFRRLGIDPGYASSPFVATFVDVTGITILFSLANFFLLPITG